MTLIVPYRDRADHLKEFVAALGDKHDIVVVEQCDDKPFNRGKLINVGYLEMKPDCFVAHDVDMIGLNVDYSFNHRVTQLAWSGIQTKDYLGGVTLFPGHLFDKLGGYHNDFWHRAEDNEMWFRIKHFYMPIILKPGTFRQLPHPRTSPEFIPELWKKAQLPRTVDMLKTCHYSVISKEQMTGYILIKVEL